MVHIALTKFNRSKSWPENLPLTITNNVCPSDQFITMKGSDCCRNRSNQNTRNTRCSVVAQHTNKSKGWKSKVRKFRDVFKSKELIISDDMNTVVDGEMKRVSFGKVEIRQHARILGDHPACHDGLALGLDWKHGERTTIMDLDLYERRRRREGRLVSNSPSRKLNAKERIDILRSIACVDEIQLQQSYVSSRANMARTA